MKKKQWSVESVRELGLVTDVETAADVLGIGRTLAYDLVKTQQFPIPVVRLGRRIIVPVPELLALLGVSA